MLQENKLSENRRKYDPTNLRIETAVYPLPRLLADLAGSVGHLGHDIAAVGLVALVTRYAALPAIKKKLFPCISLYIVIYFDPSTASLPSVFNVKSTLLLEFLQYQLESTNCKIYITFKYPILNLNRICCSCDLLRCSSDCKKQFYFFNTIYLYIDNIYRLKATNKKS